MNDISKEMKAHLLQIRAMLNTNNIGSYTNVGAVQAKDYIDTLLRQQGKHHACCGYRQSDAMMGEVEKYNGKPLEDSDHVRAMAAMADEFFNEDMHPFYVQQMKFSHEHTLVQMQQYWENASKNGLCSREGYYWRGSPMSYLLEMQSEGKMDIIPCHGVRDYLNKMECE